MPSFIRVLESIGPDGPWGLEAMSNQQRCLPAEVAAKTVFDAAVRVPGTVRAGDAQHSGNGERAGL